jgi:hypothetical protein
MLFGFIMGYAVIWKEEETRPVDMGIMSPTPQPTRVLNNRTTNMLSTSAAPHPPRIYSARPIMTMVLDPSFRHNPGNMKLARNMKRAGMLIMS